MLTYKGYTAHIQFDHEKKCLKGITKISDYEVAFFGDSIADIKSKFEAIVDQGLLGKASQKGDKKNSSSARVYPISPSVEREIIERRKVETSQSPNPKMKKAELLYFVTDIMFSCISSLIF